MFASTTEVKTSTTEVQTRPRRREDTTKGKISDG